MFNTEQKAPESTINHHKKFGSSVWEQDAAGSNPVTRTTFLRKTAYLGGFSAFFVLFLWFGRLLFSSNSRRREAVGT